MKFIILEYFQDTVSKITFKVCIQKPPLTLKPSLTLMPPSLDGLIDNVYHHRPSLLFLVIHAWVCPMTQESMAFCNSKELNVWVMPYLTCWGCRYSPGWNVRTNTRWLMGSEHYQFEQYHFFEVTARVWCIKADQLWTQWIVEVMNSEASLSRQ